MRNSTILTIASAGLATAAVISNNTAQAPTAATTDATGTAVINQGTNYIPRDSQEVTVFQNEEDSEEFDHANVLEPRRKKTKVQIKKEFEQARKKQAKPLAQGIMPEGCHPNKDGNVKCVVEVTSGGDNRSDFGWNKNKPPVSRSNHGPDGPEYVEYSAATLEPRARSKKTKQKLEKEVEKQAEEAYKQQEQLLAQEIMPEGCYPTADGNVECVIVAPASDLQTAASLEARQKIYDPDEVEVDPHSGRVIPCGYHGCAYDDPAAVEYQHKLDTQKWKGSSKVYEKVRWGISWEDACNVM